MNARILVISTTATMKMEDVFGLLVLISLFVFVSPDAFLLSFLYLNLPFLLLLPTCSKS